MQLYVGRNLKISMSLAVSINHVPSVSFNSNVLVVDDEQSICDMLAAVLETEGFNVVTANSGDEAMQRFGEYVFDVVYTDIRMDGMDGLELLQRISQLDNTVKTIIMTAFGGYDTAVIALKYRAYDYIEKPLENHEKIITLTHNARMYAQLERDNFELLNSLKSQHTKLQITNRKLAEVNEQLETLALTDSLTGLKNRRFIDDAYKKERAQYLQQKEAFTLAMVDVDNFKQYNDQNGHPAGDEVLKRVSTILLDCTRDTDIVARYGGDEYFILLSNTEPDKAKFVADRILNSIRALKVNANGIETGVTVSIGLAGIGSGAELSDDMDLVDRTDKALYKAKNNGRDQAQMYDDNP